MTTDRVSPASASPLDPGLQGALDRIEAAGLWRPGDFGDGPATRARHDLIAAYYPSMHFAVQDTWDSVVPTNAGPVPIRVQVPPGGTDATVIFFHGGSWIVGGLDSHAEVARQIASTAKAIVVQVDYRLAPEHPFPAGLDDAIAVTEWVFQNIDRLGGNAAKVAVAGDSSGGNLAAVVAHHLRDQGVALAAQLLIYPVTYLSAFAHQLIGRHYLGTDDPEVALDPRVAPAYSPRFTALAPAIIGVGQHDFLHRDNLEYAAILRHAGVAVELYEYPSLNHGFFGHGSVSAASHAAADELCRALAEMLHRDGEKSPN